MVSIKLLALACLVTVAYASPHIGLFASVGTTNSGSKSSCSKSSQSEHDYNKGSSWDNESKSKSGCSGGNSGLGGLVSGVQHTVGSLLGGVTGKLSSVGSVVNDVKKGASNIVSEKLSSVGGVVNGVTGKVGKTLSGVSGCGNTGKTTNVLDNVSHVKDGLTNTVNNVAADKVHLLKDVTKAVSDKVKGVESTVKNVGSSVLEAAKEKVGGAVHAVKGVASNVGKTVKKVEGDVKDKVKKVESTAKHVVSDVVKGAQKKLKETTDAVKGTVENVGKTVNKVVKSVTGKLSETLGSLFKGLGKSTDSCGCQDALEVVDRSDKSNSIDISFNKVVSISRVLKTLINQKLEGFGDYFLKGLVSIFKLHLCQLGSNSPVEYNSCNLDNSFKSSFCQANTGRNWLGYNQEDASDQESLYQEWGLNSFRQTIDSHLNEITNGQGYNSLDTLERNVVDSCYKFAELLEKKTVEKEDIHDVFYYTALAGGSTSNLIKKDSGKTLVDQLIDQCDGSLKQESIETLETKKTVIYEKISVTEESSSSQEVSSNQSYGKQSRDNE